MNNEKKNEIIPNYGMKALSVELSTEKTKQKFEEMLGKKAPGFLASISSVVANNSLLQKADVKSITLAAAQAAALDLPINPNIGYAAIVPFKGVASFQIMRNGYVELAMRSGQVVALENELVYEGELIKADRFRGEYVFDESQRKSNKVIGAMAYVKLANGFEKIVYWSREKLLEHGKRYSKSFSRDSSLWTTNPEAMMLKTVLKNLIVKYVPMSIEMSTAVSVDGAHFDGDIESPVAHFDDAKVEDVTAEVIEVDSVTEAELPTEESKPVTETQNNVDEDDF